jgi:hypothetical protein
MEELEVQEYTGHPLPSFTPVKTGLEHRGAGQATTTEVTEDDAVARQVNTGHPLASNAPVGEALRQLGTGQELNPPKEDDAVGQEYRGHPLLSFSPEKMAPSQKGAGQGMGDREVKVADDGTCSLSH